MRVNERISYKTLLPVYTIILMCIGTLVYSGNQSITVLKTHKHMDSRTCIVIDAGHGGIDGGAVSCTGVRESKLNLQFALRFQDCMHLLGYKTKMIRTDDRSVYVSGDTIRSQKVSDMKERVRLIQDTPRAILVSIHQNHFGDAKYKGAQVFYSYSPHSKEIAFYLQASFRQFLDIKNKRPAKLGEGVYLLNHIHCPGILVECGFLSNPEEEALLRSEQYQKHFVSVMAGAISSILPKCSLDPVSDA